MQAMVADRVARTQPRSPAMITSTPEAKRNVLAFLLALPLSAAVLAAVYSAAGVLG